MSLFYNFYYIHSFGDTPLHFAARHSKREVVLLLLENGADPNIADNVHSTPIE